MRSKDTIFNAALFRCGLRPTDQTGVYEAMEANYDEIVRSAFEDATVSLPFGRARTTLTSRSAGDFGFDDSYVLPNDVLHVSEVFFSEYSASDLLEPWEVDQSVPSLLVNAEGRTIEIEYIRSGQEDKWSANFARGVQRQLEAVIKSVVEEPEEEAMRSQEADMFLMKAGLNGSKNRNNRRIFKRGGGRILRARSRPYDHGGRSDY